MKITGIRLIIFDLDGTLINAYPAIIDSFNFTMAAVGLPARDSITIRRAVGWGDRNLLKPFVPPKKLAAALSIYRRHHAKALVKYSRLFPGVKSLLLGLKKRSFLLAVASNRPTRFSRILLRHLGIVEYFDLVLCGDKVTYMKPHPQILRTIMARLGVPRDQTLYVGDMDVDAQTGRRAGVRTIMVPTGSSTLPELEKEHPYAIIPCVKALASLFA
ncbi:MAG TPA: HAD-IA family hydrolase [Candidatus Omnitrophota bacterium]|nr:HAD-IA family hydrolase [Candidatus Omnitrophota bacterium]HQJ15570.1 HAD-IA family hydrolase [Candidatus Omnitrophota bacterium]